MLRLPVSFRRLEFYHLPGNDDPIEFLRANGAGLKRGLLERRVGIQGVMHAIGQIGLICYNDPVRESVTGGFLVRLSAALGCRGRTPYLGATSTFSCA